MEEVVIPVVAIVTGVVGLLVVLPWLVMHYITKWKTAATLTSGDEALLEQLYQIAKRLDERMDTVERLVAADNPSFQPARLVHDRESDNQQLAEIESLLGKTERKAR